MKMPHLKCTLKWQVFHKWCRKPAFFMLICISMWIVNSIMGMSAAQENEGRGVGGMVM